MREQKEILARIEAMNDPLGWSKELLYGYLDYEHIKPFLKEGLGEDDWDQQTDPKADLIDYLDFAWDKALNERGISANRSVDKIQQWLWLMEDHVLLSAFLEAPYPMYGKPQLQVVTEALAPEKLPQGIERTPETE